MKFPRSYRGLRRIYEEASEIDINELAGEYIVDMPLISPAYRIFSHRKLFYKKDDRPEGHNILFGRPWGYFYLNKGILNVADSAETVIIDYGRSNNPFFLRGLRDSVKAVKKDFLYIGRFYYIYLRKPCFLGYFSLEKIR